MFSLRFRSILLYGLLAVFIGAQFWLSVLARAEPPVELGVSVQGLRVLRIVAGALYWAIWYFGVRAVLLIWRYAQEGLPPELEARRRPFMRIGYGILWILASLAFAAIASGIRLRLGGESAWHDELTILLNLLYVLLPVLGFGLLYSAIVTLRRTGALIYSARDRRDYWRLALIFASVITGLSAAIIFTDPARESVTASGIAPAHFLSGWLIGLLILLPTFLIWMLGVLSIFKIGAFSPNDFTEEQFRTRRVLADGLWKVLFSFASVHVVLALGTSRLVVLGLGFILVAVYGILLLLLIGFRSLMRGAEDLLIASQSRAAEEAGNAANDLKQNHKSASAHVT